MGIHIFCGDCNYYLSSSKWNIIKFNLFFYCLDYIKKNVTTTIIHDINYIANDNSSISTYMLNKLCNDIFIKYYTIFENTKLTSIITLLNKNDNDDDYSITDASHIINMLRVVYECVLPVDKIIVDKLLLIFEKSIQYSLVVKIE
jgi:hypothetical protein